MTTGKENNGKLKWFTSNLKSKFKSYTNSSRKRGKKPSIFLWSYPETQYFYSIMELNIWIYPVVRSISKMIAYYQLGSTLLIRLNAYEDVRMKQCSSLKKGSSIFLLKCSHCIKYKVQDLLPTQTKSVQPAQAHQHSLSSLSLGTRSWKRDEVH